MAKIEKEQVITSYSGKMYSRLYGYAKPYLKNFIIALVLLLITTGFELFKPMLIADAMDNHIQGYNIPYGYTSESAESISFEGLNLVKDYEMTGNYETYAQLVSYKGSYYLVTDINGNSQVNELYKASNDGVNVVAENNDCITIKTDNYSFEASLMSKDDLKVLRIDDTKGVVKIGVIYAIILVLGAILAVSESLILQSTGQRIIFNIRNEIVEHIHSLPLRYFDTHPVGQIVTRATNDVETLNRMFTDALVNIIRSIIMIIGYMFVMLKLNATMSLSAFVLMPLTLIMTYYFTIISRKIYRVIRTKVSALNTFLSEHISGMKLIQVFAREDAKYKQFSDNTEDLYKSRMRELMLYAVFRPLASLVTNLALAFILFRGANLVVDGVVTVGTLYIFTSYIRSLFEPIEFLSEQFSTMQNAVASSEKIFTLLDQVNPIVEKEEPTVLQEVKGKIEFKNVWFAYDDEEYVLKDVSFVINPGEKVAFVGATGAGKSSILNLIGRYYDIQKGEILIDGVNIRDLSTSQIRSAIGQVQQDVFIFTGDIKDNIRLLNKDITMDQIVNSAKAVNASHFIEKLPKQYDEPVMERGATLSAGQRQLLSFARTLAIDPKILVMDEATANIDTETEQLIQQALETMMEGRTTIMVAHRLSTIQHADKIIVMHHGRIREAGTHQQLLAQNGIYKKLYELQLYSNN